MSKTHINKNDKPVASRTNDVQGTKSRKMLVAGAIVLGVAVMTGSLLWAGDRSVFKGVPDLLSTQRTLPPGALQVEDIAADIKGYHGTILVRGVVAAVSPKDPTLFSMIDSREARVCQDLHCAKNYLPVKMTGALPKPWDELNVRGKIVSDAKMTYLQAESVENLGSIK